MVALCLADMGKGGYSRCRGTRARGLRNWEKKPLEIRRTANCSVCLEHRGVGRGKPRGVLTLSNLQSQVHLTREFALHPAGNGDIFMGVKPESDRIGLNFEKKIVASVVRIEETGGRKTLGKFSGRCMMIEA